MISYPFTDTLQYVQGDSGTCTNDECWGLSISLRALIGIKFYKHMRVFSHFRLICVCFHLVLSWTSPALAT